MKFLHHFPGLFIVECLLSIQNSTKAAYVEAAKENADHWLFQVNTCNQCWKEQQQKDSFTGNGYLKRKKLHWVFICFSHWPPTLISLPAPLIPHEHHLFLQPDRFDSSIFPPEAAAIWNSCSLPLHLIHLSSLCKSQMKTFIFSPAPISISLVLCSSIKKSCIWPRIFLVCKMLQKMSSAQRQLLVYPGNI